MPGLGPSAIALALQAAWPALVTPQADWAVVSWQAFEPGEAETFIAPERQLLRLRCPAGVEPSRSLIHEGHRVRGHFSKAYRHRGRWWFAPIAGRQLREWRLEAPGCSAESLHLTRAPRYFVKTERQLANLDALRTRIAKARPFPPKAQAWLDSAPTLNAWRDRYRTLRPIAQQPGPSVSWVPEGQQLVQGDQAFGWLDDNTFALQGPGRFSVEIVRRRALSPEPVCLRVYARGNTPRVRHSTKRVARLGDPARTHCRGAGLQRPLSAEAPDWSEPERFQVLLPAGRYTVTVSEPSYARVRQGPLADDRAGKVRGALSTPPREAVVYPPADDADATLNAAAAVAQEVTAAQTPRVTAAQTPRVTAAQTPRVTAARMQNAASAPSTEDAPVDDLASVWVWRRWQRKRHPLRSDATGIVYIPRSALGDTVPPNAQSPEGWTAAFFFPEALERPAKRDATKRCVANTASGQRFSAQLNEERHRWTWLGNGRVAGAPQAYQAPRAPLPTFEGCTAFVGVAAGWAAQRDFEAYYSRTRFLRTRAKRPRKLVTAHTLEVAYAGRSVTLRSLGHAAVHLEAPAALSAGWAAETQSRAVSVIRIPLRWLQVVTPQAPTDAAISNSDTHPAPLNALTIRTSTDAWVRGFEAGPLPVLETQAPSNTPAAVGGTPAAAETMAQVASLSTAMAALPWPRSPDDDMRLVRLLQRRAKLWRALDFETAAQRDESWASSLGATQLESPPMPLHLRQAQRWLPRSLTWVAGDPPQAILEAAAAGDALRVARHGAVEAKLYWRAAWLRGQVLTAADRIASFSALLPRSMGAAALEPAPGWAILRSGTGWRRIRRVTGARRRKIRWALFDQPVLRAANRQDAAKAYLDEWHNPSAAVDALRWPSYWPPHERTQLRAGERVPLGMSESTPVRCYARHPQALRSGCFVEVVDIDGKTHATHRIHPLGHTAHISRPSGARGWFFVRLPRSSTARVQVRTAVNTDPPRPDTRRRIFELPAGEDAQLTIQGPTVLRLDVRLARSAQVPQLDIRIGDSPPTRMKLEDERAHYMLVRESGPLVVALRPSVGMRFRAYVRVPVEDAYQPAPNRSDLVLVTDSSLAPVARRRAEVATPGRLRAVASETVSPRASLWRLDAGLGTRSNDDEPELETRVTGTVRARHAWAWLDPNLWLELGAGGSANHTGASYGELATRAEWWPRFDRHRRMLSGSAAVRAASEPLATVHTRLRYTEGYWLGQNWLLSGGAEMMARTRAGPLQTAARPHQDHWSPYKEDHRFGLSPELELRFQPAKWWRLEQTVFATSNEQVAAAPDFAGTMTTGRFAWPGGGLRGRYRLERRFTDTDRSSAYLRHLFSLRVTHLWWRSPTRAVELFVGGTIDAVRASLQASSGIRVYWTDPQGLRALRRSARAFPDAIDWHRPLDIR